MDKIRKVPLESLLDVLQYLFDQGVDYIDIKGQMVNESEDQITITFTEDYIDPEYLHNFDNVPEEEETPTPEIKVKYTDKDYNELA